MRVHKCLAIFALCFSLIAGCAAPLRNDRISEEGGQTPPPTALTVESGLPGDDSDSMQAPPPIMFGDNKPNIKIEVMSNKKADELQFRFVVSADSRGEKTGVHEKEMSSVLSCIRKLEPQPSFMVVTGDLIQGAKTQKELKKQYDVWKGVANSFYPLSFYYPSIGNHEMILRDQGDLDAFNAAFQDTFEATFYENGYGKSVYYFDMGNARFFVLNDYHPQYRHRIAPDVVKWIKKRTDKDKAFHFVFCHEPGWPTGAHVGNGLDAYPKERDVFWSAVDAMPDAMFFTGHEHNYSRTQIDKKFSETIDGTLFDFKNTIQQVVVGGFGAPLQTASKSKKGVIVKPQAVYCYAVIDVYGDHVRVRAFDVNGNMLDDFEVKGK
jgi:hypothetical protein